MSITIIDNTTDWSSKYIYQKPPEFHLDKHPEVAIQRYYERQKQIWSEGYFRDGVKILSGKHYFYLQEVWLKTGEGDFIRPSWRDSDDLVFTTIDECLEKENKEDLLILKRREIGLTSMIAGGLSFWFAVTYPGATLNLTSADKKRFVRMFEDKIITTYNRMSPYIMDCKPKNINRSKNDAYLKIGIKKRLENGEVEDRETEFNLIETSQTDDSVANFSSSRTPLMFVDEIFLHPRIHKLLRSAKATMMKGTRKFGFFIGGGTCEDTVTQDELKKYRELWNEATERGIRTLFLPAWMGLEQFSINGWSDEAKGTEWVLKELERLEGLSDTNDAIAHKKNYPLTTDDIWKISEGDGFFEKDVMDILEYRQNQLIETGKNKEAAVKLINLNGEVRSQPDRTPRGKDTGGFWEINPPQDGQKYYLVIDGAASGKEDGAEEGSWTSATIYKDISLNGDHYAPCCHYFERPNRLEDAYRNIVTLYRYYHKYEGVVHINYETAAGYGGNFGTYLDAEGLYKAIMRRKDLTAKGNIDVNKLGTAVDENTKAALTREGNIFLRKHAQYIESRMSIAALLAPKGDNSDIRSSFLIFMASIKGWNKPKKVQKVEQFREIPVMVNVNGVNRFQIKKIKRSNADVHPQHLSELAAYQNMLIKKYGEFYWYNRANAQERERYQELKGTSLRGQHII